MTQTETILAHLEAGHSITPLDALREYGCFRLAARIKDLRDAGHDVQTDWETDGEKKWARYSLRRPVPAYAADGQGLLAL
jgi:hypothetical protein